MGPAQGYFKGLVIQVGHDESESLEALPWPCYCKHDVHFCCNWPTAAMVMF